MEYTQDYKQDKPNNERNKKSGCTAPIIIFIVIALIIFIPLAIITEDATLDDITVSNQQMSLLNFSFDFIPLFVYLRTEFPRSAILAMDFSSMRVFFE